MAKILLLFIIPSISAWCDVHFRNNVPSYPSDNVEKLCKNDNFAVLYDTDMLNPAWTSIYLLYKNVKNDQGGRKSFQLDPELIKQADVNATAFKGLNRGHLIPSYIVSWDKDDHGPWHDCYYMSNISPQYAKFNQICWRDLENKTRNFIMLKELNIYMVTGVAYNSRSHAKRVEGIAIPDYFFKVLCTEDGNGVAFYGANEDTEDLFCKKQFDIKIVENIYKGKISDCKYNPEFWKNF